MNYAELFETVKGYAENDFPDTQFRNGAGTEDITFTGKEQLDTFIRQAEQRVFNSVQLLDLRRNVTGEVTPDKPYLTTPSDWLATYSMAVIDPQTGAYEYLLNKDVNYIREAFPFPASTGKPTHYAYFDKDSFLLGPTPDNNYTVELHYFYYPPSIVDVGTSWLGDNFDSVLLYGTLLEAHSFMKGEADVLQLYQARYVEALEQIKQLSDGKNRQDMYRSGQARYPVQ